MNKRKLIEIKGITQGVGYRPLIYRLAAALGLKGFVLNGSKSVIIEIEGIENNLERFIDQVKVFTPKRARIDFFSVRDIKTLNSSTFEIVKEQKQNQRFINISPDLAICNECRDEFFNPVNRRYLYPFIACDNCGPRFSNIIKIPYERDNISMNEFPLCNECEEEYNDPQNRRFHVESISCGKCGPELSLYDNNQKKIKEGKDLISVSSKKLKKGEILAIKGIGGYHIACDATDDLVVKLLRDRKKRPYKPFAVMFKDIDKVKEHVDLIDTTFLDNEISPILLVKKNDASNISEFVAPNNRYLGVMIPYTPLHLLLFNEIDIPLVMTSGNISEEPIAFDDEDGFKRLKDIADYFLIHNRKITHRVDDPISFSYKNKNILVRNGRGYFPNPIVKKQRFSKRILALGAELKNTITLLNEDKIILSHYIGDLKNPENFSFFKETLNNLLYLYTFKPDIITCDLHPDYLSSRYAEEIRERFDIPLLRVQHHKAHFASLESEYDNKEPKICFSFDGAGLGDDNNIWGGEIFLGTCPEYKRVGYLEEFYLIGGDLAASEPWRNLIGIVGEDLLGYKKLGNILREFNISQLLDLRKNPKFVVKTTSIGRLFDAVSFICGFQRKVTYEAEAAIYLESLTLDDFYDYYDVKFKVCNLKIQIPAFELMKLIVDDFEKNIGSDIIATKFHNTIAKIIIDISKFFKDERNIRYAGITGGVFQNQYLLRKIIDLAENKDFDLIYHKRIPSNDEGISVGQAYFIGKLYA